MKYLATGAGLLSLFLVIKILTKFIGVLPAALRYVRPHAVFTTLLMSTGLTFGTISSTYGLQAGMISRQQFTVLLGAVIGSAVIPTLIAQRWFAPPVHPLTTAEVEAIEDEEFEPQRDGLRDQRTAQGRSVSDPTWEYIGLRSWSRSHPRTMR